MAYVAFNADRTKKYLIQEDYYGGPHNATTWTYYTNDAVATVDGSNYFDDDEAIQVLRVGHRIWVYQCTDKDDLDRGIVDIALHVVVTNTGTVVDLSQDLLVATVSYGD